MAKRNSRNQFGSAEPGSAPPPQTRTVATVVTGCVCLALLGWILRSGDRAEGAETPAPIPLPTGHAQSPGSSASTVVVEASRLPDPRRDGWNSEVLHDATNRQLKKLAKLVTEQYAKGKRTSIAELSAIVDATFACGDLSPAALQEIFDDGNLVVRRAAPDVAASAATHRGIEGFAAALHGFLRPLNRTGDVRVALKQFRIDGSGQNIATVVHFEAGGVGPGGAVQINATWDCQWAGGAGKTPPRLVALAVRDYEQTTSAAGRLFADCTDAVLGGEHAWRDQLRHGLGHWLARFETELGITFDGHHGLAVGDVNGDGLDDVYLCQPGGLPNRLLVQNPDGTVTDRAAEAGVDLLDETRAALIVDLDNDGAQDMVLAGWRQLLVYAGDGKGAFEIRAEIAGLFQYSLAAADYDGDGDLDLYACNYSPKSDKERSDDLGRFGRPVPFHNATNGGRNKLMRQDTGWTFVDVIDEVGMGPTNNRWSYAASWEDYDNDGDLDLYVANDFGHNNLYRNDGGRFTDVADETGAVDANFGMSVTWSDINRDGRMDLYIANMFSAAGQRITAQEGFRRSVATGDMALFRRMARGNTFLESVPGEPAAFHDVSDDVGTTMGRWSWGSLFADVNNDGHDDLLVTNGFLTHELEDDL